MSSPPSKPVSSTTVRADFNDIRAVLHYARAAQRLGLWASERILIDRFFPDKSARLIEAGCGAGRVCLALWDLGYRNLAAFDFAEELLAIAQSLVHDRDARITLFHADARQLTRHLPATCHLIGDKNPEDSSLKSVNKQKVSASRSRLASSAASSTTTPAASPTTGPSPSPTASQAVASVSSSSLPSATSPSPSPSAASSPLSSASPSSPTSPSPSANACFDGALFMFNGLMQIPLRRNRRRALRELAAVCRPGAPLMFTTHDRDHSPAERSSWRLEALRWVRGKQDPILREFGDRYFEDEVVGRTFMHLPDRAEILADFKATGWTHTFDCLRRDLVKESRAVREFSDECRFWVAHRA